VTFVKAKEKIIVWKYRAYIWQLANIQQLANM